MNTKDGKRIASPAGISLRLLYDSSRRIPGVQETSFLELGRKEAWFSAKEHPVHFIPRHQPDRPPNSFVIA